MANYEVKQPTSEEVQKFHDENPVAILRDGEPVRFCPSRAAADNQLKEFTDYDTIEKRLDEWVWAIAEELDSDSIQVWQMIHDISESKQFV